MEIVWLIFPVMVALTVGLSVGFACNLNPRFAFIYLMVGCAMVGVGANITQQDFSFQQRLLSFIAAIAAVLLGVIVGSVTDAYLMNKRRRSSADGDSVVQSPVAGI